MKKYKIIVFINFVLGFFEVVTAIIIINSVPSALRLYRDFQISPPSFAFSYILLALVIVFGLINIYLGLKLLKSDDINKEKNFNKSLIWTGVSFIFGGIMSALGGLPIIYSIYNLTSKF